jgi:hypothetical protein
MIAYIFMKENMIRKGVVRNVIKINSNDINCSLLRFSHPVYKISLMFMPHINNAFYGFKKICSLSCVSTVEKRDFPTSVKDSRMKLQEPV